MDSYLIGSAGLLLPIQDGSDISWTASLILRRSVKLCVVHRNRHTSIISFAAQTGVSLLPTAAIVQHRIHERLHDHAPAPSG